MKGRCSPWCLLGNSCVRYKAIEIMDITKCLMIESPEGRLPDRKARVGISTALLLTSQNIHISRLLAKDTTVLRHHLIDAVEDPK